MTCCSTRATLERQQADKVASLQAELSQLEAEGDEYHAAMVREDLVIAQSLARLVHKCTHSQSEASQ